MKMDDREHLGRFARASEEAYRVSAGLQAYRDPWDGLGVDAKEFYMRIAERVAKEVRRIDAARKKKKWRGWGG